MHPPKDNNRRELEYSGEEEAAFRAQVLVDARQLAAQGAPLSSAWYRLIGLQDHAVAVAAAEASGLALPLARVKKTKQKRGHMEVDCVLEERKTAGKAISWILVRWAITPPYMPSPHGLRSLPRE